jgi:hypothetical protein
MVCISYLLLLMAQNKNNQLKQADLEVMLQTFILKLLGSNHVQDTAYPD